MGVYDDTGPGIITATVSETFEPFHTGKSLVFTIAPNGHVWGKRLDNRSGKNDVEIEIFSPYPGGYIFRRIKYYATTLGKFQTSVTREPDLTAEQERKIKTILAQKERITYLLGTLVLRSYEFSLVGNYYHWNCSHPKLERPSVSPEKLPNKIKVIDCSYDPFPQKESNLRQWRLDYDDTSFCFQLRANIDFRREKDGEREKNGESHRVSKYFDRGFGGLKHYPEFGKEFPRMIYFCTQAENKKFDLRSWRHMALPPELKIMYGEHDFFVFFEIDDAVLLLEEEQTSETESAFYWTIGVAQNKVARNLMRLKSNNPELLTK